MFVRLVNISLRGVTLLSKFFLIFLLARFLEPKDVALYGLMAATIGYSLFALGFDFYTYSTRELLATERKHWAGLLRDQGCFFGIVYLVVLPALSLIFIFGLLPLSMAPWFFILVVLEHLAQELNRLLVAMSRQLLASIVLFLRSGLWAALVVVIFWVSEDLRQLDLVFAGWSLGVAAACLLGASALFRLHGGSLKRNIDWSWIRKGIKVALPLLIATLAIRGVFTLDRYWVQAVANVDVLAAYVLFAGVANAVMSFLDAGVFVFLYPKLISAYHQADRTAFNNGFRQLFIQTLAVTITLSGLAAILIFPLLEWLNRPAYSNNLAVLYWLLLAIFLYAMSMVPHYGMYAMSSDRPIIVSHIMALVIFVILAYWLTGWSSQYGVPLALCGAFLGILIYKTIAYLKLKGRQHWLLAESLVST
ncbi:hypothetical protein FGL86_11195 [Pistricoccus aurantiacus]|uniref:Oligosaccharide flippase family protein n=2 Tax=Pistricoccus aurantiacus TaxID=1883414 RepID=A0A5B8SVB2_9GAMM|nr:hypothetical protein FGL86_11195 [Pistricoccus aurantiacus]